MEALIGKKSAFLRIFSYDKEISNPKELMLACSVCISLDSTTGRVTGFASSIVSMRK
ncbi:MAG: hypothetical protein ACI9BW_002430 [Gammaproteobacteria bacterium]|jgi:hypothetical protein